MATLQNKARPQTEVGRQRGRSVNQNGEPLYSTASNTLTNTLRTIAGGSAMKGSPNHREKFLDSSDGMASKSNARTLSHAIGAGGFMRTPRFSVMGEETSSATGF